jgi:hypothetical protein
MPPKKKSKEQAVKVVEPYVHELSSSLPELPDEIWCLIISYALYYTPISTLRQINKHFSWCLSIVHPHAPIHNDTTWCSHCGLHTTARRENDMYVCPTCVTKPIYIELSKKQLEPRMICKSNLTKEYGLNAKEIALFTVMQVKANPYYRNSPPMTLYSYKEIKKYCIDTYGSLTANKDAKAQAKIDKESQKAQVHQDRRKKLLDYITNNNLEAGEYIQLVNDFSNKTSMTFKKATEQILERENNPVVQRQRKRAQYISKYSDIHYINLIEDIVDNKISYEDAKIEQTRIDDRKALLQDIPSKYSQYIERFALSTTESEQETRAIIDMIKSGPKQRKQILQNHLNVHGLSIRDDSVLCKKFIEDGSGYLYYVVDMMREMDWFFSETFYDIFRQELYEESRYLDSRSISENAKILAIKEWLKNNNDITNVPPSLHKQITSMM